MTQLSPINNLFAIQVPEDAKDFVIDMGYLIFKVMDMDPKKWVTDKQIRQDFHRYLRTGKSRFDNVKVESMWLTTGIPLPPGSYEILFTTINCSEEQAGIVARWFELNGKMGWKNYQSEHVSFPFKTAAESIQSLLRANGLDESKNYLLIKK